MTEELEFRKLADAFEMKAIADACVDSTNRSRFIIIVIIFTSILSFLASWNSRPDSYIHGRMQAARYAYNHKVYELTKMDKFSTERLCRIWALDKLGCFPVDSINLDDSSSTWVLNNMKSLYYYGLSQAKKRYNIRVWNENKLDSQTLDPVIERMVLDSLSNSFKQEKVLLDQALTLCKHRMIDDSVRVHEFLQYLERLQAERVLMFQVPIFGALVDVNDLGFFAGIAFMVILLWFRYCLLKEYVNLKTVLEKVKANKEKFILWYDYLAMRQLLTVPWTNAYPQQGSVPPDRALRRFACLVKEKLFCRPPISFKEIPGKPYRKFWSVIRILFFCLPFFVQCFVLYNDSKTLSVGGISAPTLFVNLMFKIGIAFLIVIGFLTVLCIVLTWDIDQEWNDVFKELYGEKQDTGEGIEVKEN
jgi:hypothetical protein